MKTPASTASPASVVLLCFGAALFVVANTSGCGIETDGSAGVGAGGRAGAGARAGTGGVGGGEGGFAGTFVGGTGGTGGGSGTGGNAGTGGGSGTGGKGGASGAGAGGVSGTGGKGGVAGTGGVSGTGGVAGSGGVSGTGGKGGIAGGGAGGVSGTGGASGKGGASGAGAGGVSGTGGISGAGGTAAGTGGVSGAAGTGGVGGAGAGGAAGVGGGGGTGGSPSVCSALDLPARLTGGVSVDVAPGNNPLDFASALTLEAWINPSSRSPEGSEIVAHWRPTGGLAGYAFEVGEDGYLRLFTGQGGYGLAVGNSVVPLSTWSHVAVTLRADDQMVKVAFWLNGKASGESSIAAPQPTPSSGLDIGHLPAQSTGKVFVGIIDEVRISTSAEYTADFSTTLVSRLGVVGGSTAFLYHFDSQTGGMVADSSGAERSGQLVATAALVAACPTVP